MFSVLRWTAVSDTLDAAVSDTLDAAVSDTSDLAVSDTLGKLWGNLYEIIQVIQANLKSLSGAITAGADRRGGEGGWGS